MRLLFILPLFVTLSHCVPLQPSTAFKSAILKPLIRVKRTVETVDYGNHQNLERQKKADPNAHVKLPSLETLQSVSEDVNIDRDQSQDQPPKEAPKNDITDVVEPIPSEEKLLETEEEKEEVANPSVSENAVNDDVIKAGNDLSPGVEEVPANVAEDMTEDEQEAAIKQLVDEAKNQVPETPEATEEVGEGSGDVDKGLDYNQYLWDYLYENPDALQDEEARFLERQKRGVPKTEKVESSAVVAEDMSEGAMSAKVKRSDRRSKRDLGDDLRYYLEQNNFDYPLYEEKRGSPMEYYEEVGEPSDNWSRDELEQLLEDEAGRGFEDYPEEVEEDYQDYEEVPSEDELAELAEEEEEEEALQEAEEEEAERLALLNYLYGNEAELAQAQEEYPSSYEEKGYLAPVGEYEQREVMQPSKRQYLSFLPGMRKRFYPYSYGADGRWGALVAEEQEKRSEEQMYERLLRLAAALRGEEEQRGLDGYKK